MSETHSHDQHSEDDHSHAGTGTYLTVFGVLVVLTAASFALGNSSIMDNSPGVGWAGMMAISCGKAMLVILFFMHLKWEANWKYVLTIPALMMSVFIVCMLTPDIGFRQLKYSRERKWHSATPAVHEKHDTHAEHDAETEPDH